MSTPVLSKCLLCGYQGTVAEVLHHAERCLSPAERDIKLLSAIGKERVAELERESAALAGLRRSVTGWRLHSNIEERRRDVVRWISVAQEVGVDDVEIRAVLADSGLTLDAERFRSLGINHQVEV